MIKQRNLNAVLGILGILFLGISLLWFPKVVLHVPMPSNHTVNRIVDTLWVILAVNVMPYFWAVKRLRMGIGELGLTTRGLSRNILLGCGLYSIALVAFLYCSDDPLMSNHAVRHAPFGEAMIQLVCMGAIAAGSDIMTRGFVLLTLAKYSHVVFAIIMQNLTWFMGHLHEIDLLSSGLGRLQAVGLTLVLGILGDMIVLKTRSVVGLAIAHILLNVFLVFYIRQL